MSSTMSSIRYPIAGLLLAFALFVGACGDDPAERGLSEADVLVARSRAAALFADENFAASREALLPLLGVPSPAAIDLLSGGILAMELSDRDEALRLVRLALEANAQDPAVNFVYARLLEQAGRMDAAIGHLRRALASAPNDQPTRLALAWRLVEAEQLQEAEQLYQQFLDRGVAYTGSWHLTGLHQLATLLVRTGRGEAADELWAEKARLEDQGLTVPSSDDSLRGTFGRVRFPDAATPREVAVASVQVGGAGELLMALSGVGHVQAATAVDDWEHLEVGGCRVARSGLLAYGPSGAFWLPGSDDDLVLPASLTDGAVSLLIALDVDNDRDLDLVVVAGTRPGLLLAEKGSFLRAAFELPEGAAGARAGLAVDYDHDGDLDIALVGPFGLRLWRNDGIGVEGGRFTDATAEAVPQPLGPLTWIAAEDFDTDQDVDLLVGNDTSVQLLSNLRAGRFAVEEVSGVSPAADGFVAADFDADGRPDIISVRAGRLWLGRPGVGAFIAGPAVAPVPSARRAVRADVDSDGRWDVLWVKDKGEVQARLAAGFAGGPVATLGSGADAFGLLCVDVVGSPSPETVAARGSAVTWAQPRPVGNGFRLALRGIKDNARGVGAVVELRSGALYQRFFWQGEPQWIGLGSARKVDVLRITWPNGVVQHDLDIEAGCERLIEQAEGLVGSCPFLYTFNGESYEFISDVLGITPLGLPMAPGMLVPPDHDEYVRIGGEQLAPLKLADGRSVYEMQITEELREVTYLDQVRLLVVDHPAGTEMEPNERFTFPPFPEPRIHVMGDLRSAKSARGSDGKDWTAAVAKNDGEYAAPFTAYRGQWLGLANPHFLELSFDAKGLQEAKELRLAFTGWFYWTDASVNMATARTPGVDFIPPILQVPDPANGPDAWRDVGPPVGFPAGKSKTMVLDVSSILDRADPRLRVFCSLRLYWDSIRLAVGGDEASQVTQAPAESAWLWERGFSKPIFLAGEHRLEWFDWNELDEPRWNQHPGLYTRHGEVLPLLSEADDCFVIMGAGDALRLRFDATDVPALKEGWRRDFLLFLDGWAKDRDPNTLDALHVEPLPFHGMKGYPYTPEQRYPDTEKTRAYRAEWNTRHGRRWFPSLVPSRAPAHVPLSPTGGN